MVPPFLAGLFIQVQLGMDSMSGSIRDSEPTSPTSPGSPDPNAARQEATSPVTLTQALSSLSIDPPNWAGALRHGVFMDSEALITIDICLVSGVDPIQIANVQVTLRKLEFGGPDCFI